MRPTLRRPTTIAVLLAAGLALGACDAIDGDLAQSATTALDADGDVAASAFGGDVVVTTDQLAAGVEAVLGVEDPALDPDFNPQVIVGTQITVLNLLVQEAVYGTAAEEEFGVRVTDDDVEARLDELIEERGGIEALEAELAGQNLTVDQLRLSSKLELLAPLVDAALREQGGPPLQDWARQAMDTAEPVIARRFGQWDPVGIGVVPADPPVQGARAES